MCKLSDCGVAALAQLHSLTSVHLSFCMQLTDTGTTTFPFFYVTENLAERFPSDCQILPSDFLGWEFSTISPNSDGEIRNSDGNSSARFSVRSKKGRCLVYRAPVNIVFPQHGSSSGVTTTQHKKTRRHLCSLGACPLISTRHLHLKAYQSGRTTKREPSTYDSATGFAP